MKSVLQKLIMAAVLLIATACGNTKIPNGIEIPELRDNDDIVVKKGYTASYNHVTLVPNWVAWELTATELRSLGQFQAQFKSDGSVRSPKVRLDNYRSLPKHFDKGHMAPAKDMRWDEKVYEEAFLLTNVCPMNHYLNAGSWRKIEKLTRRIANHYGSVYVVCGPIFSEDRMENIGLLDNNIVCVPDAFFKAIAVKAGEEYLTAAFVVENKPLNYNPQSYAITVDSVETITGINLFPSIKEEYEAVLGLDEIMTDLKSK